MLCVYIYAYIYIYTYTHTYFYFKLSIYNSVLNTRCTCTQCSCRKTLLQKDTIRIYHIDMFFCTIRFFALVANSWVGQPWLVWVSVKCLAICIWKPPDFKIHHRVTFHSLATIQNGDSTWFNHCIFIHLWYIRLFIYIYIYICVCVLYPHDYILIEWL